jgi:uncharacterized protein YraI
VWCQVTYAGRTGWASERFLDTRVAAVPQVQPWVAAAPQPQVTFGFGITRAQPWYSPWHGGWVPTLTPGWYRDHYWDGGRWYYDGGWHARPRAGFFIGFGT